jgi:hypothetical protein
MGVLRSTANDISIFQNRTSLSLDKTSSFRRSHICNYTVQEYPLVYNLSNHEESSSSRTLLAGHTWIRRWPLFSLNGDYARVERGLCPNR